MLVRLTSEPLELLEVVRAVTTPEHGGVASFTGTVRNHTRERAVEWLEYEAYVPMAERQLRAIADDTRTRWPGALVAIVHRLGRLMPAESAVVIAVSTPHRAEAFAACQFVIDQLKQRVPIWKKERFSDGETWVGLGP